MQRSAAALQAAGNTLDESIALFTAAQTTTQDADVVGTALKTVSMRLRSASTDEMDEEGLDTEGMADSAAKLRKELKALTGVDIMVDDSNFKSTYQILTEIAKVWDEMSDVSQASALELMFGKRQGSIGAAILQNVEVAENAYATSLSAAGSAEKENAVYLESIQGRLDKLTASYQVLSSDLIGSDLVKTVVSGATTILDLLDGIVSHLGSLPTLAGAAALAFSSYSKDYIIGKNIDVADSETGAQSKKFVWRSQVENYAYRDAKFAQLRTDTSGFLKFSEALKDASARGEKFVDVNKLIVETMNDASEEAKDVAREVYDKDYFKKSGKFDVNSANGKFGEYKDVQTGYINNEFNNNFIRDSKFLTDDGVAQIREYNTAVDKGSTAIDEFKKKQQELDPVAKKMIDNSNGQKISIDYLTSSVRNGSLANSLYAKSINLAEKGSKGTAIAFRTMAGAARTASTALNTLGISAKSVMSSLAFTTAITIAMALLQALISKIDDIIHRTEKLKEKAEESAQAFEDASSNLQEYKNELASIGEKIAELEGKDTLSLTDKEELDRL